MQMQEFPKHALDNPVKNGSGELTIEPELIGTEYQHELEQKRATEVEELNEHMRPYKFPLRDRVKALGKEDLFAELQEYAQTEICDKLNVAFPAGEIPSEAQMVDIRDFARANLKFIAGMARSFAMHHREPDPYRVGGAALVYRNVPPGENPWAVLFDANTKLDKELTPAPSPEGEKWCAEQNLMDRITKPQDSSEEGVQRIVSMVIVGEARPDDVSIQQDVKQITLTPCYICRRRMLFDKQLTGGESPILPPDTEVYSIDANHDWRDKYQKVRDLPNFHKDKNLQEI